MSQLRGHESRKTGKLTNSDISQAQIQGFELVTPVSYPIYELLEGMKGPVLQIQNYRISTTQDDNRMLEWSPSKVPVLTE